MNLSSLCFNFSVFAVCFLKSCMKLIVDDQENVATKQVVDMELNSVLFLAYDLISYTRIVWIEFEANVFKV